MDQEPTLNYMFNYPPGEDQFHLTDADWKRMLMFPFVPIEPTWDPTEKETAGR